MLVYVMFVLMSLMRFMHGVRDTTMEVLALLCIVQLLGALAAPRERRQYLTGLVVLVLIALDFAYYTVFLPATALLNHTPGERATWLVVIVNAVVVCGLFVLPYLYAYGSDSRQFFGLPPRRKK